MVYLAQVARHPEELGLWQLGANLVGEYRIEQLANAYWKAAASADQEFIAASALARLQSEEAVTLIRQRFQDPRYFWSVIRDLELVRILGLEANTVAETASKLGVEDEVALARCLAFLGEPEELRKLARKELFPEAPARVHIGSPDARSTIRILIILALGDVGTVEDARLLAEVADQYRAPNYRLESVLQIGQICNRVNRLK